MSSTMHLLQAAGDWLAAPDPTQAPDGPTGINTGGILTFLLKAIVPIGLALLGVVFVFKAMRGNMSQVMTASLIAIIGVIFIGGAAILPFVGDDLAATLFK